jgi:hypothetical protein
MAVPLRLLPLTVTWQTVGETTDTRGNTIKTWDPPGSETEIRAYIERSETRELTDRGDAIVTRWLLVTNELGIDGYDRVVWDDLTFEVDGHPWKVQTPTGTHHLEAHLRSLRS